MSDPRASRAQELYWEIDALERLGARGIAVRMKRREAARLHEERSQELLGRNDVQGWIDLFAAITYWGKAGERSHALRLLGLGARYTPAFSQGRQRLEQELAALQTWLDGLQVIPSLTEFDRPLPAIPRMAA